MDTAQDGRTDYVIVGGGAGGLLLAARLARRLGGERPRVLLVDREITHVWKPGLHQIAAGTLDSHHEALPYPLLARRNGFRFALGHLSGLDPAARRLTLAPVLDEDEAQVVPARPIDFGQLVLATGAGSNLFGTPGAAEHALRLEDAEDARVLNRRLTTAFLGAAFSQERVLRVAIIGGGPTGVELAAELRDAHSGLLAVLPPDQRFQLQITVLEMAPDILGALPEPLTDSARETLGELEIRVMTQTRVERVRRDGLDTSEGPLAADLTVWAAGVQADEANTRLGLRTGKLNQFVVDDRLRTSTGGIWALGDCAEAPGPGGKPLPARAQVAAQQARYLADVLLDREAGRPADRPFVHRERGTLVSLGEDDAAGAVPGGPFGRRLFLDGPAARWLHGSLRLNHHRAVLGLRRTLLLALARRLHRGAGGRARLH